MNVSSLRWLTRRSRNASAKGNRLDKRLKNEDRLPRLKSRLVWNNSVNRGNGKDRPARRRSRSRKSLVSRKRKHPKSAKMV
jgi:hypothetical protein